VAGPTLPHSESRLSARRAVVWGLTGSAVLHAAAALVISLAHVGLPAGRLARPTLLAVELLPRLPDPPPAVELPRPRVPVPRPSAPAVAIPAASFDEPHFIPHDVPPRLLNAATVRRALEDGYPEGLPDAAVRSHITLWLFVDEGGVVRKLRLQGSSGFRELDDLAARVAPRMAFRPALHRGRRVGVWISQPIRFQPGREQSGR